MTKKVFIAIQYLLLALIMSSCQARLLDKWDDYEAIEKAFKWKKDKHTYNTSDEWVNASYYLALNRAHALTQNEKYLKALIEQGRDERWYSMQAKDSSADCSLCASYLYLDQIGISEVSLLPTAHIINNRFCNDSLNSNATDHSTPIWDASALYIAAPLMVAYAKKVNDQYFIDQMHAAFTQTYKQLYSTEHQLFYQASHSSTQTKNTSNFRLHDNSMILTSLALILEDMPADYKHRPFYKNLYCSMAKRIVVEQGESGLWSPTILEASTSNNAALCGSSLCTFALAWGINNQLLLTDDYLSPTETAWNKIRQYQEYDGKVGCQSTAYNCSQEATSTFILAGSEIIKLNKSKLLAIK